MFDIGAPELLVLIVIAVIVFGPERLPEFARKAARVVNYVRGIAGNAQQQLSKELGPGFEDMDFRDLNPKAFIQKHLLDDVEPIVADVKKEISSVGAVGRGAADDFGSAVDDAKSAHSSNGVAVGAGVGAAAALNGSGHPQVAIRDLVPFDTEST